MLDGLLLLVSVVLLGNLLVGLVRVGRGPAARDRLSGLLLLTTTGVALLVVLAHVLSTAALRDAALALVALAVVIVVVRVTAERRRA